MTEYGRATELVMKLRPTNFFAALDENGIGELAKMLTFAYNATIAEAAVNQWLEEQSERPTPADLRKLVAYHNALHDQDREAERAAAGFMASYLCRECQDTGLTGGGIGPGGVPWSRCGCAKGQTVPDAELQAQNAAWRQLQECAINPKKQRIERVGRIKPKPLINVGDIYRDV